MWNEYKRNIISHPFICQSPSFFIKYNFLSFPTRLKILATFPFLQKLGELKWSGDGIDIYKPQNIGEKRTGRMNRCKNIDHLSILYFFILNVVIKNIWIFFIGGKKKMTPRENYVQS